MAQPTISSRFRGCLLGMATGDAVGTTVEFQPPGSFPEVTDMLGGGKFSLQPGQVRDAQSSKGGVGCGRLQGIM